MRGVEAVQSLGKLVASQASYYTEQLRHSVGEDVPVLRGRTDYYAGHESPSRWMGSGLSRLDLTPGAAVDNEVFTGVMGHRTPDGEKMTVHRSHGKVAAYDHTFSAPKSVSLLYAYGDDEIRDAVVAAHRKAVSDAVSYMEERCSVSRISRRHCDSNGEWKFSSRQVGSEGYVAAGFDHFTSRANDPQVHTHVVVINRVWAENGWRAIDAKVGYAHLKAGGTVYQASLRKELTQHLGVAWQQVHDGMADIAGFSPELLRHYSTRRREIEEAVERYVATGKEAHPRVYQKFTLETRQPKTYPRGEAAVTQEMKDYGITSDIVDHWNQLANTAPEDVEAVIRNSVRVAARTSRPVESIHWSETPIVEEMADRRAVFTERDLLPGVAGFLPQGATPNELVDSARRVLEEGLDSGRIVRVIPDRVAALRLPESIALSDDELAVLESLIPRVDTFERRPDRVLQGETRYTTRIQLQREERVLDAVTTKSSVRVDREMLESAIVTRGLVGEQTAALRHLADLDGRLVALVGPGGSGKTRAVGAYADAVRNSCHHVVGVATSATAARRLGQELSGGWSGTIAMMRHQLDSYDIRLPEGTVVMVDEASMVSTRDLAWLVSQAEHCDGKIMLVGDPKQLPSIDSGGLFHRIVADGHGVVTDLAALNQRQTLDVDRHALDKLRHGQVASAVHEYGEAGRLHLGGDEYTTKTAMVDAWWTDARTHGVDQVRMLASRRDEVAMLNQLARIQMQAEGLLEGTTLVNRWGTEFQAGDRIVVRDNWYAHSDLRNGQTGTITTVHPDTRTVTFLRDIDGVVVELPGSYVDSSVDHAYAQTIHTAQGQTFGTTHLYVDTGIAAEHGYTALSRARGETHLWVNTSRTVDGRCINPGQPGYETPVESLVRQLTRSVVSPPAVAQGLAVEDATDQQLHQSLHNLEHEIQLLNQTGSREEWIEDHADLLHTYTVIKDELAARTTALAISYQLQPPADVLDVLGRRESKPAAAIRWDTAVSRYAAARVSLGPDADLTDLSTPEARLWQAAVDAYHPLAELEQQPTLKMAG